MGLKLTPFFSRGTFVQNMVPKLENIRAFQVFKKTIFNSFLSIKNRNCLIGITKSAYNSVLLN